MVQESRLIVIVLSIILLVSVFPSAIPRLAYGNFGICSYSIDYLSGPAPLTVTLSNIHITTGGEHYNTGTVTFWYSINGQWYQHYTAPVEGPIATAPDKSLTFTEPGQYEITMRCEHSSGEVIDSPYINAVMVGAGGSSPEPPPEPDSYECYSQFQDGFCWEATYENAEDYATVRIDGVIQYDKLVYEITGDGDVTAWFSLLDDLSQIPERYCDIETCTGLPNIRSIPNQGEITLNRDGYYTIVGHSVSSQYAWVYTNVHWPFEEPEEFDYVVSANPASLSVTQGNRASYDITVSLIGGEAQQVDLTRIWLDDSTSNSYTMTPRTPPTSFELYFDTDCTWIPGTYRFAIEGESGGITRRTQPITLEVKESSSCIVEKFDFDMTLVQGPSNVVVNQGDAARFEIKVNLLSGDPEPVSMTIGGSGIFDLVEKDRADWAFDGTKFKQGTPDPAFTTELVIQTTPHTAPDLYKLEIKGFGGTVTRSIPITIEVKPFEPVPPPRPSMAPTEEAVPFFQRLWDGTCETLNKQWELLTLQTGRVPILCDEGRLTLPTGHDVKFKLGEDFELKLIKWGAEGLVASYVATTFPAVIPMLEALDPIEETKENVDRFTALQLFIKSGKGEILEGVIEFEVSCPIPASCTFWKMEKTEQGNFELYRVETFDHPEYKGVITARLHHNSLYIVGIDEPEEHHLGLYEGQWVKYQINKIDFKTDIADPTVAKSIEESILSAMSSGMGVEGTTLYDIDWVKTEVKEISGTEFVTVDTIRSKDGSDVQKENTYNLGEGCGTAIPIDIKIGDILNCEGESLVKSITTRQIAGRGMEAFEVSLTSKQVDQSTGVTTEMNVQSFYDKNTGIILESYMKMSITGPGGSIDMDFGMNAFELDTDELTDKGVELFQLDKHEEAIAYFDKVLKIEPKNFYALEHKGAALNRLDRHEQALPYLYDALEIEPTNIFTLTEKGYALEGLGKFEEALQSYYKVLEIEPDNAYALEHKQMMLEKLKGGGCLIATAAFGSELTPQVQFLRGFRDNHILSTAAGSSFMNIFNTWYYSFSPNVADAEREIPVLQQTIKYAIYPLLGILTVGEQTYSMFSGETGAVMTGLVTSSMIGFVYFSPIGYAIGKVRRFSSNDLICALMISLAAVIAGILISNSILLMITTSAFVITVVCVSAVLSSKLISKIVGKLAQALFHK